MGLNVLKEIQLMEMGLKFRTQHSHTLMIVKSFIFVEMEFSHKKGLVSMEVFTMMSRLNVMSQKMYLDGKLPLEHQNTPIPHSRTQITISVAAALLLLSKMSDKNPGSPLVLAILRYV